MRRKRSSGNQTAQATQRQVTPKSLARGDYMTMRQARTALGGIEGQTLREWMKDLEIQTYHHPTDRRATLIRSADVAMMAKISDRPFLAAKSKPMRASSRAQLEQQLIELRRQHEEMIARYESQIAGLKEQHQLQLDALNQQIRFLQTGEPG